MMARDFVTYSPQTDTVLLTEACLLKNENFDSTVVLKVWFRDASTIFR